MATVDLRAQGWDWGIIHLFQADTARAFLKPSNRQLPDTNHTQQKQTYGCLDMDCLVGFKTVGRRYV